jgi:hypothetical protein
MINKGFSVYSQYGEDGILEYLLSILNITKGECCEFGMSGIKYSNTFNLVKNKNWYGIYIEREQHHLDTLNQLFKYSENITLIQKSVETSGENSLDSLLSTTDIKKDFDILSIDIDGIDYHIWDSLKNYNPKIVIIEINPFYKPGEEYINDGTNFSSSFTSVVKLGESKGYTLVCMTGNLIFVRTDLINWPILEPNELFIDDAYMIGTREIGYKRYVKRTNIL